MAEEAAVIPLYGFLRGDSLGLLVLVNETDTVAMIAQKLQTSADVRVAPSASFEVMHGDRVLDPRWTVKVAGLTALERFDVVTKETS